MVMNKHKVGLIRDVPRNAATTQRLAMEEVGANAVLDLAVMDRIEVFDHIRRGDRIYVTHLHILAERRKRTDHKPRRDLFWWVLHLLERGTIVETSTGRVASLDDIPTLFAMLADAVERITQGTRGRIARENGKLGGRPRKVPKPEQTEVARRLWFEKPEIAGKRLRQSLRRAGYSRTQAYREFGPRGGRD